MPGQDRKIIQGETIAAIATAIVPQQGSVGIVRLSGASAITIGQKLFQSSGQWESHRILYGYIHHPNTQQTVDEALLLFMQSPRSYTREDVVEFHCHGGIMAVQQVLQLCIAQGARLAEPGEFTLRAFLNGRLDLTQAEGIADLVGAQSPQAAQAALAGIQGKLTDVIRHCRSHCLDVLAEVEARIDFADDLPPLNENAVKQKLESILADLDQILATAHQGELLRTGLKVAIVGQPNVGKSSLLNAWSRCDRAIVTDLPGTTRDVVESQLVVAGIPIQVLDTAGIRNATDQVEQLGIERSQTAAQSADVVLLTVDSAVGWTETETLLYKDIKHKPHILVVNKVDLGTPMGLPITDAPIVHTVAAEGKGIDALEQAILTIVHAGNVHAANIDLAINQRQAAALTRAQRSLKQVHATIEAALPLDFWTIDLRDAIRALGEVTGEEMTESMLDEIFSRFCIGK
ncbi:tRNA uridine-5-carboxymethylaminomethyl(34) synthesis GTPase MnmE [Leptothoe spongobia]|uniref:tRNA uridine-5-carboxymethylaminomethyl(34) synthesis GTPase MnmE n=1 Tax=Leptothoe spongobia TaxID=2651728 RepID=UPI001C20E981|nr:tRNA uridine-5-carboxymethylaminomethyl(34) synthesis GTPase MnmE [Leptothoe spongobia]